jgi:hypothetical protein
MRPLCGLWDLYNRAVYEGEEVEIIEKRRVVV